MPRSVSLGLVVLALLTLAPPRAAAQAPQLQAAREALAEYDLDGDRTIATLRELDRLQRELTGNAQSEARFLRAAVAVDLLIAATLDPAHAALASQVCEALAVPCDGLADHLRAELAAISQRAYRRPAMEAVSALEMQQALAAGEELPARWLPSVRVDLLLLAVASRGLAALPSVGHCGPTCPPPWSSLDEGARRELEAVLVVSRAATRVARAAAEGDPLARALRAIVDPVAARFASHTVNTPPVLPEALGVDPAAPEGEAARADLVVIVGANEVRIARPPSYAVRDGELVPLASGDDVLPSSIAVPLPSELPPVIAPIDPIVQALAACAGGSVAIAPTDDAPAHVIARVLVSAQRAGRAPSLLARRAHDGTLRAVPIALADRDAVGGAGDVVVRVRLGGYDVARARGRTENIPRVRHDGARRFDLDGLAAAVGRIPHRRTVLDAMPSLAAHDLLDAAFRIGAGATLTLAL